MRLMEEKPRPVDNVNNSFGCDFTLCLNPNELASYKCSELYRCLQKKDQTKISEIPSMGFPSLNWQWACMWMCCLSSLIQLRHERHFYYYFVSVTKPITNPFKHQAYDKIIFNLKVKTDGNIIRK